MITLKEWMELVDYKITEGENYTWECYGYNAYQLSSWNGLHGDGGWSFNIVFDTKNQTVYEVYVCDYTNERAYRIINSDFKKSYHAESDERGALSNEAWDGVNFIDLEVDDDFIQKSLAIKAGEQYDDRVLVPVEFSDEDLLKYMKLAHERDITFNQLIEEALRAAIDNFEKDPVDFKRRYNQRESEPHGY